MHVRVHVRVRVRVRVRVCVCVPSSPGVFLYLVWGSWPVGQDVPWICCYSATICLVFCIVLSMICTSLHLPCWLACLSDMMIVFIFMASFACDFYVQRCLCCLIACLLDRQRVFCGSR
jgi:hypothetical protein